MHAEREEQNADACACSANPGPRAVASTLSNRVRLRRAGVSDKPVLAPDAAWASPTPAASHSAARRLRRDRSVLGFRRESPRAILQ